MYALFTFAIPGSTRARVTSMTTSYGVAVCVSHVMRAVGLAVVALVLISCQAPGSPDRPSVTASRTEGTPPTVTATVPSPTRSPIDPGTPTAMFPDPTRSPIRPETPTPTSTPTAPVPTPSPSPIPPETPAVAPTVTAAPNPTLTPEPSPSPTSTVTDPPSPSPSPSPTTVPAASPTAATTGVPSWLWWLLAAVALGVAVALPLVLRARRRRGWLTDFAAAEKEVAWYARDLIPELQRTSAGEQVAGGWAVGSSRVVALEDRLTALEASAPDDASRDRARALREAVRGSRSRTQDLVGSGAAETLSQELAAVATDLEAALGAPNANE